MQVQQKTKGQHGGRRPGAGRKPNPAPDRLKKRCVYLTDQEWQSCQCNTLIGMSPSEYIRLIIQHAAAQRWLTEQGAGSEQDERRTNTAKTDCN